MFASLYAPGNAPLLLECAGYFSPLIEETSCDSVAFDIRGLRALYGSPESVAAEIQRRVGIEANLALAVNPDAAIHAARGIAGTSILSPRRAAEILAPLPLFLLGGSPEFARTMDLWGIRTFGELAALPADGIVARLGDEGQSLQRLARGAGRRQLRLVEAPLAFVEDMETEYPLDSLEPMQFLLAHLLGKLCQRLRFHARSTCELRLRLKLERAADHSIALRLPVPTLNQKTMFKLLELELRERPPCAPVERIWLEAVPTRPRTLQHGLFLPAAPEPERMEITLARLRALVGAANVGSPELSDSWRADAFRMGVMQTAGGEEVATPVYARLALRRFRPPCPARVWRSEEGRPGRIVSSVAGGNIVACAGPWRTSGDWWSASDWDREEWDVEIRHVGVARIYLDCGVGAAREMWFVEGNYD